MADARSVTAYPAGPEPSGSGPEIAGRAAYRRPELRVHGELGELTRGFSDPTRPPEGIYEFSEPTT